MLRRLYDWTMLQAAKPNALAILAAISFIESSVFPIPPDVLLIPLILAQRERAFWIAGVCTVASVAGGFLGYVIGYGLYETIGVAILGFYGYLEKFTEFQGMYNDYGAWIVFFAGLTPFPYKVITIASGVTALDPVVFGLASLFSRGLRFFLIALLLWYWGAWIRNFIERYFGLLTLAFFALLVGGFALLALL